MTYQTCRAQQSKKCLQWIEQYPGWWYLICTPGDEHMTLSMMQKLIKRLYEESLYELIFVLLMVHRQEPFMKDFFSFALLERLIGCWEDDREKIVAEFIAHFE